MTLLGLAGLVFFLAWKITGCLYQSAWRNILLDRPNQRSLHTVPVPRTGGLAIIGSFLVGIAGAVIVGSLPLRATGGALPFVWEWIVCMTVFVAGVSFFDDRKGLVIWGRLCAHFIAASGVVLGAGLMLSTFPIPWGGEVELGRWAPFISVLFLVWMANLYNFMDGMDGFAGGMTVIGSSFLSVFAGLSGHYLLALLAILVAAAAAGFLLHNFPPAQIFMGDVGSVPLGFLCGSIMLLGFTDKVFDFWVPIVLFSPFAVDATITLFHRALRCERVWEAHRDHYYQRVVLSGWSHRRTVLAEYAVMAFCGMLAILYNGATEGVRLIVLVAWSLLFLVLAGLVNRLQRGAKVREE